MTQQGLIGRLRGNGTNVVFRTPIQQAKSRKGHSVERFIAGVNLGCKPVELAYIANFVDAVFQYCFLVSVAVDAEAALVAFVGAGFGLHLKPVQQEKLLSCLEQAMNAVLRWKEKSLIVKSRESSINIMYDNILYAELIKKNVVYHLISGRTVETTSIRSTFAEAMGPLLQDGRFALCGSVLMVNLHYIGGIGNDSLTFRNGRSLHISKRASRELRNIWYDFHFDYGSGL